MKKPRFVEETLQKWTVGQFVDQYRFRPESIRQLVEMLRPFDRHENGVSSCDVRRVIACHESELIEPRVTSLAVGGREDVPLEKRVLIFLNWVAHRVVFRTLALDYGITPSCAFRVCNGILRLVNEHLKDMYIVWPNADRQRQIAEINEGRNGFPGVIGSIDGSHIQIKKPLCFPTDYYNTRRKIHTIVLQVTVFANFMTK